MKAPAIAFFGTPRFAVTVLEELRSAGFPPALIITAPDKPRGRGLTLTPPEAKLWAQEHEVDVLQPERLTDPLFLGELRNSEWDLFIVAAYGKLLPKELLAIPERGTLNVHPSLLPRFRGASPIQSTILENAHETGVTVMLMDEEMDHGPLVAQASIDLDPASGAWPLPARDLEDVLAREGGRLLAEVIPAWMQGSIEAEPQKHERATLTKKIAKEDGLIDLSADGYRNYLRFLAFKGWPGVYFFTERNGKRLRVIIADAQFKDGSFIVTRVTPEGGREMSYEDFMRG